tara:strand:- start:38 stop:2023 length:1986 start_codon:yes stop_codon:yes gene_type:complete
MARTIWDYLTGAGETMATLGSGAVAPFAGGAYGIYKGVTSPNYGTIEGGREADRAAIEMTNKLTYQPRGEVAQGLLGTVGSAVGGAADFLRLPPVLPEAALLGALGLNNNAIMSQTQRGVQAAKPIIGNAMEGYIARTGLAPRIMPEGGLLGDKAFDVSKADASDIFGAGAQKTMYKDPSSGGYIQVLTRPDQPASVTNLEVPEAYRNQGIGGKLQAQASKDFPNMQGQVSSKAAAKSAYKLGRRPVGQPDASLDDVLKTIDDNSSVNLVSPARQQEISGSQGGLLEADYRGSHVAPNAESYGGTLDDLGKIMPADVYSSKGIRLYGLGDGQVDAEWFKAAYKAKGNPDAEVEVYRAVPKGVKDINNGDWVTTSKTYANQHGERSLDGDYEIIKRKVKANTLSSEGYPYEFGYNEPKTPSRATEFQAPQTEALKVAQSNAALPVDQGGLGLPANNTPMDRAKAMGGKDMVHFSRSGGDYTELDSGKFAVAPFDAVGTHVGSPQAAMDRFRNTTATTDQIKGTTYPVTILGDRPLMNQNGMPWGEDDLNAFLRKEGGHTSSDVNGAKMTYQDMNSGLRKKLFEDQGYSSIPYFNEVEGKGSVSYIVPPKNIRSQFAAFDPMRRDEPNLLAGAIPFTPFLATDEEQRNSLMQSLGLTAPQRIN